ncbi:MAG: (2Fe-2S)-binding protein [Ilumatobacteraceae bacterium]
MADITKAITVNGVSHTVTCGSSTPLLWVLRDFLELKGTKFGCGIEQCYACTVFINGVPEKSCDESISEIPAGANIVTIEGLKNNGNLHYVQEAWIAEQVPQCGWCQSGAIMRAVDLLNRIPNPTDADIDSAMKNICACGTYPRMRAAIHTAVTLR